MLHKIRRFYYNNKIAIWKVIFIIVFLFLILQVANYMTRLNNEKKTEEAKIRENTSIKNNTTIQNSNTYVSSDKGAVTGTQTNSQALKTANSIINDFVNACNNGDIETAYNWLSTECKEEIYNNIGIFQKNYVEPIFGTGKKTASIQNWTGNIYKINYKEDIMEAGKSNGMFKQDFITIVKENGKNKLNIQGLIEKYDLKNKTKQYNIEIEIVDRKVYKEYEEYTVKVVNNRENIILLDTQESSKSIYLKDNNSTKYFAYTNELSDSSLHISSGQTVVLDVKFAREYNNVNSIKTITFSDIILNYGNYLQGNKEKFQISLNI